MGEDTTKKLGSLHHRNLRIMGIYAWKKSSGIVKIKTEILDFQHHFRHVTILETVTISLISRSWRTENKGLFGNLSETWVCRANHDSEIWRYRLIQIVRTKICIPGAECSGPIEVETLKWQFSLRAASELMWQWEKSCGLQW